MCNQPSEHKQPLVNKHPLNELSYQFSQRSGWGVGGGGWESPQEASLTYCQTYNMHLIPTFIRQIHCAKNSAGYNMNVSSCNLLFTCLDKTSTKSTKWFHVTPILRSLHWFLIHFLFSVVFCSLLQATPELWNCLPLDPAANDSLSHN